MRSRIDELTGSQIRAAVGSRFQIVSRALGLSSKYLGVDKDGYILFRTTSGTTAGKYWYQKIDLIDLRQALSLLGPDSAIKPRDAVNLAVFGDVAIHCTDPSWKYWGWKYIGTQLGYAIHPENRKPVKRNPALQGTVCKHLYNVLQVLPFHINSIVRDLRRRGFIAEEPKKVAPSRGRNYAARRP